MRDQRLRATVGFGWGLLLFLGVASSVKLGFSSTVSRSAVISQVVLKTARSSRGLVSPLRSTLLNSELANQARRASGDALTEDHEERASRLHGRGHGQHPGRRDLVQGVILQSDACDRHRAGHA